MSDSSENKLEEKMTIVRQCLKNVVFPGYNNNNNNNNIYRASPTRQGGFQWGPHRGYSSARNQLTSKTKTKGPGGSAVKNR